MLRRKVVLSILFSAICTFHYFVACVVWRQFRKVLCQSIKLKTGFILTPDFPITISSTSKKRQADMCHVDHQLVKLPFKYDISCPVYMVYCLKNLAFFFVKLFHLSLTYSSISDFVCFTNNFAGYFCKVKGRHMSTVSLLSIVSNMMQM